MKLSFLVATILGVQAVAALVTGGGALGAIAVTIAAVLGMVVWVGTGIQCFRNRKRLKELGEAYAELRELVESANAA